MRIILINDSIEEQGGERPFNAARHMLSEQGHAVEVLAGGGGERFGSLFTSWFSPTFYRRAACLFRRFKPDIIHCHNISRIVSPAPLAAARRAGIPVVFTVRDPHLFCAKSWGVTLAGGSCPGFSLRCLTRCRGDYDGYLALPYYLAKYGKAALHRKVIRGADYFICPSQALFAMLLENFPESAGRSVVLPNFIEPGEPSPIIDLDPHRFLFVGRITAVKGLHIALEAVAQLAGDPRYREIALDVVGDGPEARTMQGFARTLGIAERVSFHGRLDQQQLERHYARCCALLAPSICVENNPRVVLEAMRRARPVIASAHGGFPDLIEQGRTGLLCTRECAPALAQAMAMLYGRDKEAQLMGRAGRAKLVREFSKEAHYTKLLAIYERVAGGSGRCSDEHTAA